MSKKIITEGDDCPRGGLILWLGISLIIELLIIIGILIYFIGK